MPDNQVATPFHKELIRQGNRINTQYSQLKTIIEHIEQGLTTIKDNLDDENVKSQLTNLGKALETYVTRSEKIYGQLSANLIAYGNNTQANLDNLAENITGIQQAIDALNDINIENLY